MPRSLLFFKELLRTPTHIGAVCPSSEYLARTICEMLPRRRKGTIVEVGPGTGALTAALMQRIRDKDSLILVERSPTFAAALRKHYPNLAIIQGDAAQLTQLIPGIEVAALVSSLPLLALPAAQRAEILRQYRAVLPQRGRLIFMSYSLRCNQEIINAGFTSRYHRYELRNLPPARVDCFLPA